MGMHLSSKGPGRTVEDLHHPNVSGNERENKGGLGADGYALCPRAHAHLHPLRNPLPPNDTYFMKDEAQAGKRSGPIAAKFMKWIPA